MCLALFGDSDEAAGTETESTEQAGDVGRTRDEVSGTGPCPLAVSVGSRRGGTPVSSGAVADRLDEPPPSVTEM